MSVRKKLCCLFSAILAVSMCMPVGVVEAIADQGESGDSAVEVASDGSEAVDDAIVTSTSVSTADSVSMDASASSDGLSSSVTSTDDTAPTLQQALAVSAGTPVVMAAGSNGSGGAVDAEITGISIERPLGNPVDEVSQGSSFYLVINWKVSDSNQILQSGDYFDLTLPDTLLFPSSYTDYEFSITDSNNNVVGTAYITPGEGNAGGTVHVVFNSNINGKYSVDGTIYIQTMANTSTIDLDTPTTITVSSTASTGSTHLQVDTVTLSNDEVLGKWGVRSTEYDNQVYWNVRINYGGSALTNVVITDTLTNGDGSETSEEYVTDSFSLTRVEFSESGGVTHTYETINLSDKLTFSNDNRTFTINLGDVPEGYHYRLTYRTTYTSGTTLSNTVSLTSTEKTDHVTSSYVWQSSSGNADGDLANRIEIIKVDAEDNSKTLAGATFLVTADDGSTFELTTGEDGTVTSDLLTAGTYTVVETTAPDGYELDDTVYTLEVSSSGGAVLIVEDNPAPTSGTVEENEAGSSVTPSSSDLPKTGDAGTPAASLAAIALAVLATAVVLRRRAASRSGR
jgi:LPXTG-motif cell wall-anchored protein